ncbi:transcription factor E4F1 isoform X2 [Acipenser ruthenus]|uniref:transcription factor E4F1 isoform X2 n=1 Tax=Acipenser ruthenus TaxID=7906 RepID=UPI00145B19A7|nr:transcription factor E4F1 isoform X2 [Acipenser ruthenus]
MNVENNNTAETESDPAVPGNIITIHTTLGDEGECTSPLYYCSLDSQTVNDEDVHKCGRCQCEFTCLEAFIQHKLQNNCQRSHEVTPSSLGSKPSQEDSQVVLSEEITVAAIVVDDTNVLSDKVDGKAKADVSTSLQQHQSEESKKAGKDEEGETSQDSTEEGSKAENMNAKLTVNRDGRYVCQLCKKTFKTANILRAHLSTHSDRKNFTCKLCGNAFRTKGSLIRHNRRHTDERPYRCNMCGLCFRESGALTRHLKSITPCTEKIRFHQCKEILVHKDGLPKVSSDKELDIVPTPSTDPTEVQQSIISVVTDSEENVLPEVQVQMEVDSTEQTQQTSEVSEEPQKTDGDNLISQAIINSGITIETVKDDTIVKHTEEPMSGTEETEVRMGEIQVTEECVETDTLDTESSSRQSDPKTYKCPHCNRVFSGPSYLRLHIKGHLGHRPFKCLDCEKEFITWYLLKKHMESHVRERRFKCGECGKLYKTIGHVREHMRAHSDERPYSCSECGKGYKTKNALQVHVRTHFNEKPYMCQFCSRGFREKGSLVRHIRHHTGEKPFKCNKCGRGFAEHGTLNRHLRAKGGCFAGMKDCKQVEVSEEDHSADNVAATIISEDPHTVLVEFSSVVADTQEYIIEAPGESGEDVGLVQDGSHQVGSHIMKVVQQIVNQANSGHQIIVQNVTMDENAGMSADCTDTITIATPESLTEQVAMTLATAISDGTILTTEGSLDVGDGAVTMVASQDIEVPMNRQEMQHMFQQFTLKNDPVGGVEKSE